MNRKIVEQKYRDLAEWLLSIGAEKSADPNAWHPYSLVTKGGVLRIKPEMPRSLRGVTSFWIFCRFDSIDTVAKAFGLKPTRINESGRQCYDHSTSHLGVSGKWNFGGYDLDATIGAFKSELGILLLEPALK